MKKIFVLILLSFISNIFAQNIWVPTNGPIGGTSYSIAFAPNGDVYSAAGDNGIYRSTNGGNTWILIRTLDESLNYKQAYYITVANNGTLIASGGGQIDGGGEQGWNQGVFITTNNGISWLKTGDTGRRRIVQFAALSNGYIFGAIFYNFVDDRGGIFKSTDWGNTWTEFNIPLDVEGIRCIAADINGYVYAGITRNFGYYYSTNFGNTWTQNSSFVMVDVTINPQNGNVFGANTTGVYRSTNHGTNWSLVSSGFTNTSMIRADINGNITAYSNTGIYKSSDNGNSWINIPMPSGVTAINNLSSKSNGELFLAVTNDFMYKTSNNGTNWTSLDNGIINSRILDIAINSTGYIFASKSNRKIYISTDNGTNWNPVNSILNNVSKMAIDGLNFIYAAVGGQLYKSTDNGNNFVLSSSGLPGGTITKLSSEPDGNLYITITSSNGLYRSTNSGSTWSNISTSIETGNIVSYGVNTVGAIFLCLHSIYINDLVYRSTNGGTNWIQLASSFPSISHWGTKVGNPLYILTKDGMNSRVYKSSNNGDNWTLTSTPLDASLLLSMKVEQNGKICVSGRNSNITAGAIFYSNDAGLNWVGLVSPLYNLFLDQPYSVNVSPDGFLFFCPVYNLFGLTYGYNSVWRSFTSTNSRSVSGFVRFQDNNQPVTSGYVKAVKYYNGQVITLDSTRIQSNGAYSLNNFPQDSCDIMAFQDDEETLAFVPTYYVSTINWQNATKVYPDTNLSNINIGVYRIQNTTGSSGKIGGGIYYTGQFAFPGIKNAIVYAKVGNIFKGYSISNNTGSYRIDSLPMGSYELIADRMGYIGQTKFVNLGTVNLDTVNFYFGGEIQGINIENNEIPKSFQLSQNYPNPFNPVTTFKFQIPKAEFITLKIYDILGREIAELLDAKINAGYYNVSWDASQFSSGVYFYKLTAGNFVESKKMVLIK